MSVEHDDYLIFFFYDYRFWVFFLNLNFANGCCCCCYYQYQQPFDFGFFLSTLIHLEEDVHFALVCFFLIGTFWFT